MKVFIYFSPILYKIQAIVLPHILATALYWSGVIVSLLGEIRRTILCFIRKCV